MNTREEKAVGLFAVGYNCAQAVFGAFCEEGGLELSSALKLASGFGGGARCGELCGAVSGAILTIGLKCGFYIEGDFGQKTYCNEKSYEFIEKFKEAHGSALCRDLLGIDIRRPEDHAAPAAREAHKSICPKLVASAVVLLENMELEK
jgi:C_GCAxxG_C_C family probable redox protein